jgi:hypothetical protein
MFIGWALADWSLLVKIRIKLKFKTKLRIPFPQVAELIKVCLKPWRGKLERLNLSNKLECLT